jgi:hypothetical protein
MSKNDFKDDNTYKALMLSTFLEEHGRKPVYAYCGYNYYRLVRVIDMGEYIVLESPESDGCWMPSDSIRDES